MLRARQKMLGARRRGHPAKTFIGRVDKGFDFLGYHFCPGRLTVAAETVRRFVARACQLYEQGREKPDSGSALGEYVRRWVRWVKAGLFKVPKHTTCYTSRSATYIQVVSANGVGGLFRPLFSPVLQEVVW